jgi:glycine/D-amino acid oxidase-like deaminating enzyme
MRKFRKVFPGRPEPQWRFSLIGEVGLSQNLLPRLCELGPDAWGAYGYSGTGINFALLLGGELARLARGLPRSDGAYPVTQPHPVKLRRSLAWGLRYLHAPLSRGVISRVA